MKKVLAILLILTLLLSGCASGVDQADYDALKHKLEKVEEERDELEDELEDMSDQLEALQAQLDALQNPVSDAPEAETKTETETTKEEPSEEPAVSLPAGEFDEETVLSQLTFTEYSYDDNAFLVVRNNSAFGISLDVDASFYDKDGSLLKTDTAHTFGFSPGTEALLDFYTDEPYASMEYTAAVSEYELDRCITNELTWQYTRQGSSTILSVTNNTSRYASSVKIDILYLQDGKAVYSDTASFHNVANAIAPGETIYREVDCYATFNNMILCCSGYGSDGTYVASPDPALLPQLDVTEYDFHDESGTYKFVAVTNNASSDMKLLADCRAYNTAGDLISVCNHSEDYFASGTQTLLKLHCEKGEVASMEYTLSAVSLSPDSRLQCITQSLSHTIEIQDKQAVLSITNNGKDKAYALNADVLFFRGNKVVYHDLVFFHSEPELAPGSTCTADVPCNVRFDSAQVFPSAYRTN